MVTKQKSYEKRSEQIYDLHWDLVHGVAKGNPFEFYHSPNDERITQIDIL